MIDLIFLDLDDTILDFGKAEEVAIGKTLRRFGVLPTEAVVTRYSEINRLQWEKLERGELNRAQVKLRRFEILFEELGVTASAEEARRFYEEQLGIGHYFMEGAEALLESLAARGARLFLASNGTFAVQQGRIASAGIAKYFEKMFISEQLGAVKPQKEFFDICFAQIPGFARERAVIFGDSLTSDILGGINVGIKTCWFNPKGKPGREDIHPDGEIQHLSQFVPWLEQQT